MARPILLNCAAETHVARTGDIGLVSIVAEGAVSAGVRRIEALTGMAARRHLNAERERLRGIAASLKVGVDDAPQRVVQIAEERRKLERDLAETRRRLAMGGGEAADAPETIGAIRYLASRSRASRSRISRAWLTSTRRGSAPA